MHKGMTQSERNMISVIPEALAETEICLFLCQCCDNKGRNQHGRHQAYGKHNKTRRLPDAHNNSSAVQSWLCLRTFRKTIRFMAGAFCGVGEPECAINVGVSGPGAVASAIRRAGDCDLSELSDVIKKTAFKSQESGSLLPPKRQNVSECRLE